MFPAVAGRASGEAIPKSVNDPDPRSYSPAISQPVVGLSSSFRVSTLARATPR
jgi:hypothetical protein